MRIAIMLAMGSPWARQVALQVCRQSHSVHVIDFCNQRKWGGYLRTSDDHQSEGIALLRESVEGVHLLDSRFRSHIRYFTCPRQLRDICRSCEAELLLSLYGGGWGTLAYLSKVRPFAVYLVGCDILMASTANRFIGKCAARAANRFMSRRALSAADIAFVNGGYLAEKTRELVPRANLFPLVIGVDADRFSPAPGPSSPTGIVCTRGFSPLYNNEYLIRGLAELATPTDDIQVTFVSAGDLLDATRSLADQVLAPAMRRRVKFLGGGTDSELLSNLQGSHIYVSLSRSDGTSISLLEALSCGLFPILSDIPQNREWIDPTLDNGILVPLDQPRALAAALSRAISDAPLRARAAEINRQLILERADSRRNMGIMASELQAVVRNQKTCRIKGVSEC